MPNFILSRDTSLSSFLLRSNETGIILATGAITEPILGQSAVTIDGNGANLVNYGVLLSEWESGVAVFGNLARIANDGLIGGLNGGISVIGSANIDNSGIITADVGASSEAISMIGGSSSLNNSGSIWAVSSQAVQLLGFTAIVGSPSTPGLGNTIINSGVIRSGGTEAILFGSGADRLTNTGTIAGTVTMGNGNDRVANNGTITGTVSLGAGDDRFVNLGLIEGDVLGGLGRNTFDLRGGGVVTGSIVAGSNGDVLLGGAGEDLFVGGLSNDRAYGGQGDDFLTGGSGLDTINGGSGDDFVDGGSGSDTLSGGSGDDTVLGGKNNDVIFGGTGDDTITGGQERDAMTGGGGSDTFKFVAFDGAPGVVDTITDFRSGQDQIDLESVSVQLLSFRGTAALAGGGQASVNYAVIAGSTTVRVDNDGNGTVDLQALLSNVTALTAADFLL